MEKNTVVENMASDIEAAFGSKLPVCTKRLLLYMVQKMARR